MSASLSLQWMEWRTRWRRVRRKFDARMMTERRILIVAAVCISWFALDAMWVTPAYQRLKASMQAHAQLKDKQAQSQIQQDTLMDTLRAQKQRALAELDNLRVRLTRQQDELQEVQAQMAPARDMRQLLDALLARHANLRVLNMKTLPPVEVKAPGSNEAVLYRCTPSALTKTHWRLPHEHPPYLGRLGLAGHGAWPSECHAFGQCAIAGFTA